MAEEAVRRKVVDLQLSLLLQVATENGPVHASVNYFS